MNAESPCESHDLLPRRSLLHDQGMHLLGPELVLDGEWLAVQSLTAGTSPIDRLAKLSQEQLRRW